MTKLPKKQEPANHIAVFQETIIRRTWHNEEWWFAIVDVVGGRRWATRTRHYNFCTGNES